MTGILKSCGPFFPCWPLWARPHGMAAAAEEKQGDCGIDVADRWPPRAESAACRDSRAQEGLARGTSTSCRRDSSSSSSSSRGPDRWVAGAGQARSRKTSEASTSSSKSASFERIFICCDQPPTPLTAGAAGFRAPWSPAAAAAVPPPAADAGAVLFLVTPEIVVMFKISDCLYLECVLLSPAPTDAGCGPC